jgi:transcriptional regulator with XRE-family HTH domain
MRPRSPVGQRDVSQGGHAQARVHISAIGELSAGRDPQLGQIFRNMRVAMKISREALARRLATTPMTIDSFEAGAINGMPHWRETVRIVRGYCELLRLDPEPILWRIKSQLQAVQAKSSSARNSAGTADAAAAPAPATRNSHEKYGEEPARPKRRRARALFAITAPVALLAVLAIGAQALPQPLYYAIGFLPAPVAKPIRAGLDYVVHLGAPSRDGLKWIELSDPRLRKADKSQ